MTVKKEVIGGITTFLTMAYILAVNPTILSATGMDEGAVFTSTVISAIIGTLVMAFYAKMPFSLAPGMGLNAFFAYTVVMAMGYTWQFALTAVFLEGIVFILLTVTGIRNMIVNAMPLILRRAISPGIGMFIAFIGLRNAGVITPSDTTIVTLGPMHDPGVLLTWVGIIVTAALLIRNVTGALLIGIILTTIAAVPLGLAHITSVFSAPPSIEPVAFKLEWHNIFSLEMLICVMTFLFLDMFDTIGTLIGVSSRAGMADSRGNIPGLNRALMADAIGTTTGALLGSSTVTTFVESATGVNAGGRSGLTAFVSAVCFGVALFFAPLFLAIPPQATSVALVLVGIMMMVDIRSIDFSDFKDAVPCFICVAFMPFAYSISDGIMLSIIVYVATRMLCGRVREIPVGTYILAAIFILRYICI
ncbi:MAG: NCS2 family permease [Clostridium sp.]|nr:NCS2 family permease [Clostridium sp.]